MVSPEKLTQRQFKSLTGCSKEEFYKLLPNFMVAHSEMKWQKYDEEINKRQRKPGGGNPGKLNSFELKLYFILYFLKNYPTYDVLGAYFDMSGSNAYINVIKLYPVLEETLSTLKVCPLRNTFNIEELKDFLQGEEEIFIDATVRPHHRPCDDEEQKKLYDGKKKAHTVKNTVITNAKKVILFLGQTVAGKIHDYKLLKSEFDTEKDIFENLRIWIDLGYLGFEKDYNTDQTNMPHKKTRKSKNNPNPKLSSEQKNENKEISKVRVIVENAIGGIKRYRILTDTYRAKNADLLDKAILIAAGLWNYKLKYFQ